MLGLALCFQCVCTTRCVAKVLVGGLRPVIACGINEYLTMTRFARFAIADDCVVAPKGFADGGEAFLAQVLFRELEDL